MDNTIAVVARYRFDGREIARRRRAADLRRERLAVAVDRTAATIMLYETGKVDPNTDTIALMAFEVGCTPGDFFVPCKPDG
jgi:transcriptional regulator with XRE-family HTH domain